MKTFFTFYGSAFVEYCELSFHNLTFPKSIARYAILIDLKAKELLQRASLNPMVNFGELQKEIYRIGKEYILKFSEMLKSNIISDQIKSFTSRPKL